MQQAQEQQALLVQRAHKALLANQVKMEKLVLLVLQAREQPVLQEQLVQQAREQPAQLEQQVQMVLQEQLVQLVLEFQALRVFLVKHQ